MVRRSHNRGAVAITLLFTAFVSTVLTQTDDSGVVDIRLSNGSSPWEGRVEVLYNGQWGTVCRHGWDQRDADVVCRYLFYSSASSAFEWFGEGTGWIALDEVNCDGKESNLKDCSHNGWGVHDCTHFIDAGVRCSPPPGYDSTTFPDDTGVPYVRLSNGYSPREGRVEVLYKGQWGTVCKYGWDQRDAEVVCRYLFHSSVASALEWFGEGTGWIVLEEVNCNGKEADLKDCSHNGWGIHDCDHSVDVGVRCSPPPVNDSTVFPGDIVAKLVGGNSSFEGRVEVRNTNDNETGMLCSDGWDLLDATVVCRYLGFRAALAYDVLPSSESGQAYLIEVNCNGDESNLANCGHSGWGFHTCNNGVAGASCAATLRDVEDISLRVGAIRLTGGNSSSEGRVEVYIPDQWGTICDDNWDLSDATVVCRQLGYSSVVSAHTKFGEGSGQTILLDDVECSGDEAQLLDCFHVGWGKHDCSHREDVGVICSNNTETNITLAGAGMMYRLFGSRSASEGVLQFRSTDNETWNTLCSSFRIPLWFGAGICRQAGYSLVCHVGGVASVNVTQEAILLQVLGNYPWKQTGLSCRVNEDEQSVWCGFLPYAQLHQPCTMDEIIWINCGNDLDFRLVYGIVESEGMLQTRCSESQNWQGVCGDQWMSSAHAHQVVCRHLGFPVNASPYVVPTEEFGSTLVDILLSNIECPANGAEVADCTASQFTSCPTLAGLRCGNELQEKLELRLVDSYYHASGVVVGRVSPNGDWGAIRHTDKRDADVVCRHLGFKGSIPVERGALNQSQIPQTALVNTVGCFGNERKLSECPILLIPLDAGSDGSLYVECFAETERYETKATLCGEIHYCGFNCNQGPRDTLRGYKRETCKCDDACVYFNDCCYDYYTNCRKSSPHSSEINGIGLEYYACMWTPGQATQVKYEYFGFALVSFCPEEWVDISTRQNCERTAPLRDVINWLPVYDSKGVAYKNVFCAICHSIQPSDLHKWNVGVPDDLRIAVLWDPILNRTLFIEPTNIRYLYTPPRGGGSFARTCPAQTVNSCSPNYATPSLEAACQDYFAPVNVNGTRYKNTHCAICNGEEARSYYSCDAPFCKVICSPFENWSPCSVICSPDLNTPTINALFDFGWDGDEDSTCVPGHVYDPVLQRCRTLLCTSGVADGNSECVDDSAIPDNLALSRHSLLEDDCEDLINSSLSSGAIYWQASPANNTEESRESSFIINVLTTMLEIGENSCHDLLLALEHNTTKPNRCNVRSVNLYIIEGARLLSEIESCKNATINATEILHADARNHSRLDFAASLIFSWDKYNSSFRRNVVVPQECLDILTMNCTELVILFPEEFVHQHRKLARSISHTLTGFEFGPTEFVILQDGSAAICGPVHWSDSNQVALGIVSDVCGSLSLLALTATFVTYCVFSELRNMAGLYTINLVVALFVAILLLLLAGRIRFEGSSCVAMASIQHLSWLSAFFWMTTLSFNAAKIFGRKIVSASRRGTNTRQLMLSMALVWGAALLIVSTCLVLSFCHCTNLPAIYNDSPPCLMSSGNVLLVVFGVPVAVSLIFNTLCFVFVLLSVRKTKQNTKMVQKNGLVEQVMDEVKIYAKLFLLFGLTWIIAFVTEAANSPVLFYINVIINTLQGVFIFIAFCLNDRVRALWRKKLPCLACMGKAHMKQQSTSSTRSQGSTYITDVEDTRGNVKSISHDTKL